MGPARGLPTHPAATMVTASPVGWRPQVHQIEMPEPMEPSPRARTDETPKKTQESMEHGPRTGRVATTTTNDDESNCCDAAQPRINNICNHLTAAPTWPLPTPVTPTPLDQGGAHGGAGGGHDDRYPPSCHVYGDDDDGGDDGEDIAAPPVVIMGDEHPTRQACPPVQGRPQIQPRPRGANRGDPPRRRWVQRPITFYFPSLGRGSKWGRMGDRRCIPHDTSDATGGYKVGAQVCSQQKSDRGVASGHMAGGYTAGGRYDLGPSAGTTTTVRTDRGTSIYVTRDGERGIAHSNGRVTCDRTTETDGYDVAQCPPGAPHGGRTTSSTGHQES